MQVLVIGEANWADEMDCYYSGIWNDYEWTQHLEKVKEYFETHDELTLHVGSNEEIEVSSFAEYERHFKTFPITKIQADFLKSVGLDNFGQNLVFENYDED